MSAVSSPALLVRQQQPLGRRKDILTLWGNFDTESLSTFLFKISWVCSVVFWEECWFYILSFYILPCFNHSSFQVCCAMVPFSGPLMQHIPMAGETSALDYFLVLHTVRARLLQLLSWQLVINLKFNSINFHLLPCELSPPARERSDCSAVVCSLCSVHMLVWLFSPPSFLQFPFALCPWRLLCKGKIKQSPRKENAEQRKGNFVRIAGHMSGQISPWWRQQRKCNIARANGVCWGKVLIASGPSAWLPANPLCT